MAVAANTSRLARHQPDRSISPRSYWPAIEIDHIVSLELGGSNDISNLYPEKADAKPAGYHVKDTLENELHRRLCHGDPPLKMTLRTAQRRIASNWQKLYEDVYGHPPTN